MSAFIDEHRDRFGVEPICRALAVAPSTYYARRDRPPSARALADAELLEEIHAARTGYRAAYGARRTWRELGRRGIGAGRDRVGRLMRAAGLEGVRRGRAPATTRLEPAAEQARDLVERRFAAPRPNALWVADLTYLRTYAGFLYLAFILDVFARRVVGWQIAAHMRTELVLDALEMAVALRRPPAGLIAHTDRGSQYTSIRYTERLEELGIAPSVGSAGDAYDNAMAEAFVGTFKAELVAGRRFAGFLEAEREALRWIGFYNHERLHEALGDVPPAEFEENSHLGAELAALSGDLTPRAGAAHVLTPPPHGPCGPVEAGRPALIGGAPAGLGTTEHAT